MEQLSDLLSLQPDEVFRCPEPKGLQSYGGRFEAFLYSPQDGNAGGLEDEFSHCLSLGWVREEPIGMPVLHEEEIVEDIQTYAEAIFKVAQQSCSARIFDESWPRRIPRSRSGGDRCASIFPFVSHRSYPAIVGVPGHGELGG